MIVMSIRGLCRCVGIMERLIYAVAEPGLCCVKFPALVPDATDGSGENVRREGAVVQQI